MIQSAVFEDVAKIITLAEEVPVPTDGITSRTIFKTSFARVILFRFSEGEEMSEHTSVSRVIVQILTGKCEFTVGTDRKTLIAGDIVYMPPKQSHAVKAVESFSMLVTLVTLPTESEP
jgi:quercetin dioxygenase-like cupin family protein